ncbi:MAG: NUDIX domain-containing protein [bacterium]|nr:NUDIX domain-containing protein [bacterium]
MKREGLSASEALLLGSLLAKAKFPLPPPAFDGWVENLPHVALELAVVRQNENGWHVFMAQREHDDKFWPNEWHMPGTIIREGETTRKAYRRLLQSEMFSGGAGFGKLQFVDVRDLLKGEGRNRCRRGHELAHLYTVSYAGESLKGGDFFPISKLPGETSPHHHTLIAMAKKFLET